MQTQISKWQILVVQPVFIRVLGVGALQMRRAHMQKWARRSALDL